MTNEMREYLFRGWPGCSNGDCIVRGSSKGMHTNGTCKCIINADRSQLTMLQNRLRNTLQKHEEE